MAHERLCRLDKFSRWDVFDEAVALVGEMTGVEIPKRSAEQIVREAAVDFDRFYTGRAAAKPTRAEILVGSVDGKGVPMVKPSPATKVVRRKRGEKPTNRRMAAVGTVYGQAPGHEARRR